MTSTPRKLQPAAIKMAARGPMERVETQVAMALGASVQPLTKMTPKVRSTVRINMGFETRLDKKSCSDNVMSFAPLPSAYDFTNRLSVYTLPPRMKRVFSAFLRI